MYREMLQKRKQYLKNKGRAAERKSSPARASMGDDLSHLSNKNFYNKDEDVETQNLGKSQYLDTQHNVAPEGDMVDQEKRALVKQMLDQQERQFQNQQLNTKSPTKIDKDRSQVKQIIDQESAMRKTIE